MFDDYEIYQGLVLRRIIVAAPVPLRIAPYHKSGRVSAFVLNERVGVFVKHSSKRLSPWSFTFLTEHLADLSDLATGFPSSCVAFTCGKDGLVMLPIVQFRQLVDFNSIESEQNWIRIVRKPRSMYAVSGKAGDIAHKVAQGPLAIVSMLQTETTVHDVQS